MNADIHACMFSEKIPTMVIDKLKREKKRIILDANAQAMNGRMNGRIKEQPFRTAL